MSDAFLEEQLRRIRELSERMSQLTEHSRADEVGGRRQTYGPLHDVRDVRIVNSVPAQSTASGARARRSRRRRG